MADRKLCILKDPDYGFIIADATVTAQSFVMVPRVYEWAFETREEAEAQIDALKGREIEWQMIETPDRFEAVADTLYGPAW